VLASASDDPARRYAEGSMSASDRSTGTALIVSITEFTADLLRPRRGGSMIGSPGRIRISFGRALGLQALKFDDAEIGQIAL
jgi:hypothetical protein